MPCLRVVEIVKADAELAAVLPQGVDLLFRDRVGDRQTAVGGRHVVVGAWPRSARAGAPCGRPAATLRRPGGWSLHGPVAGRCKGSSACPARHATTCSSQIFANIVRGVAHLSAFIDSISQGKTGPAEHGQAGHNNDYSPAWRLWRVACCRPILSSTQVVVVFDWRLIQCSNAGAWNVADDRS